MNIADSLRQIIDLLHNHGIPEPGREAPLLVALAIGKDRTFLIAHPEYELTSSEKTRLDDFAARRADREPFQYISGRQEFFGLEFDVSPDVLIPRPETEILVEKAIEILSQQASPPVFCEVGIGSGCIAVAILRNVESASAIGLDVSEKALETARTNARKHNVANRLSLQISSVYDALESQKFDMIVSNPPYVPVADLESLQSEVRDFEPCVALTDGGDGLSIIRRVVADAPQFLKSDGHLLIEIGFNQSERVAEMFDPRLWHRPGFLPDLQGIPRIVHSRRRNNTD